MQKNFEGTEGKEQVSDARIFGVKRMLYCGGEEKVVCYIARDLHCIEILEDCTQEKLKLQG